MVRLSRSRVKILSRISTHIENSLMTERVIIDFQRTADGKNDGQTKNQRIRWMLL